MLLPVVHKIILLFTFAMTLCITLPILLILLLISTVSTRNLRRTTDSDENRYLTNLVDYHDPKTVANKESRTFGDSNPILEGYQLAAYESSKNDGADVNGRHVIFTTFQPDTGAASDYKLNHTMIEAVLSSTAKLLSPGWRIHVLVSDDKSIEMFTPLPGLQVVDYRTAPPSERLEKFQDPYVSQTKSKLSSENFRMRWWILIAGYLDFLSMKASTGDGLFGCR